MSAKQTSRRFATIKAAILEKKNPITAILHFYRPREWYYHLGIVLIGILSVSKHHFSFFRSVLPFLIGSCYLAYGYSFNLLCDRPSSTWRIYEIAASLAPLIFVITWSLHKTIWPWLLIAVTLNTLYSWPTIRLKRWVFISVPINVYLFGVLFFIGAASIASASDPAMIGPLFLGVFIALWLVPAQLLHELSHAHQDERPHVIHKQWRHYLIIALMMIGFLGIISIYIKRILGATGLFVWGNLIWLIFFYRCIWLLTQKNLLIQKANQLRRLFRLCGFIAGLCYVISLS